MDDINNVFYKQKNKQLNDLFRILVFGGFGSGKSSVINALLGQNIMPMYPIPSMQPPIVVKYGKKDGVVLHFGFLSESLKLDVLPHKIREHIQLHGMRAVPPLSVDLAELEAILSIPDNAEISWIYYDGIIAYPSKDEFIKQIKNQKINDIKRKGKFLIISFLNCCLGIINA